MLCCGGRKERASEVPGAAAGEQAIVSDPRESDPLHLSAKDSGLRDPEDTLPWWKREVLEERANLRQEELERETRRRHAQHVVALEQHRRVVDAQHASFVESERRQLLRSVAVELEESERARRIVSSGALNASASAALDSSVQRVASSPVQDPARPAPSPTPTPAPGADLPKRVRFQDSPPAAAAAADAAAAAAAEPAVLGRRAVEPAHPADSPDARDPIHPQQTLARTSPTAAESASLHRTPTAAHNTGTGTASPANVAQVFASDAAETQAQLRLNAIALSGPGRLERLRGKSSAPTGNVFGSSSSSDRWSWNALQSGDAAWGFDNK